MVAVCLVKWQQWCISPVPLVLAGATRDCVFSQVKSLVACRSCLQQALSTPDPSVCRFCRYGQVWGTGRFKQVYRGFNEKLGTDIAWSKIQRADKKLDDEQIRRIVAEMSIGLDLDHPNIIR